MNTQVPESDSPQELTHQPAKPTSDVLDPGLQVDSQEEVRRILYGMGFVAKDHISLAEKLLSNPPKDEFERVMIPKKLAIREKHLCFLRKLIKDVRIVDMWVDDLYAKCRSSCVHNRKPLPTTAPGIQHQLAQANKTLSSALPKFGFNWAVTLETAVLAEHIRGKIECLMNPHGDSSAPTQRVDFSSRELKRLEEFVRMPPRDYLALCDQLSAALKRVEHQRCPPPDQAGR